jgi:hypothetical protein
LFLAERLAKEYRSSPYIDDLHRLFEKIARLLTDPITIDLQHVAGSLSFMTINPAVPWDKHMVLALLRRSHLLPGRIEKIDLAPDEWLLADLARHLDIGISHLRRWMFRTGVHWRQSPLHGYYIIWADADEQKRLRKLNAFFNAHPSMSTISYPKELTTPKPRPQEKKAKTNRQD